MISWLNDAWSSAEAKRTRTIRKLEEKKCVLTLQTQRLLLSQFRLQHRWWAQPYPHGSLDEVHQRPTWCRACRMMCSYIQHAAVKRCGSTDSTWTASYWDQMSCWWYNFKLVLTCQNFLTTDDACCVQKNSYVKMYVLPQKLQLFIVCCKCVHMTLVYVIYDNQIFQG